MESFDNNIYFETTSDWRGNNRERGRKALTEAPDLLFKAQIWDLNYLSYVEHTFSVILGHAFWLLLILIYNSTVLLLKY